MDIVSITDLCLLPCLSVSGDLHGMTYSFKIILNKSVLSTFVSTALPTFPTEQHSPLWANTEFVSIAVYYSYSIIYYDARRHAVQCSIKVQEIKFCNLESVSRRGDLIH